MCNSYWLHEVDILYNYLAYTSIPSDPDIVYNISNIKVHVCVRILLYPYGGWIENGPIDL